MKKPSGNWPGSTEALRENFGWDQFPMQKLRGRDLFSLPLLPSQFADGVARIKESIKRGEVSQVVLSQRISQEYAGDPSSSTGCYGR